MNKTELIDTLAARFVLAPTWIDVVVASNHFGDFLSDLAAALAGTCHFPSATSHLARYEAGSIAARYEALLREASRRDG